MKIKYQTFRDYSILIYVISHRTSMRVEVAKRVSASGVVLNAEVNWSSFGDVEFSFAKDYGEAIQTAAEIAAVLDALLVAGKKYFPEEIRSAVQTVKTIFPSE